LTDLRRLTGILDWEYAQYGDPFYDLARVIYYQECAKAYVDEKRDKNFEYDFTTRLIDQLKQFIDFNSEKYTVIRSLFFIDSIIWALGSADPAKNLATLQPPRF
jgi:thiamine kinase-like enzyme